MGGAEIRGARYTLKEVFGGRFAFSIPAYQRPYAWTAEHAGALLDDLLAALGEREEEREGDGAPDPYFLGTIVLVQGDAPEASIVDGQQRLITLTILLAALRATVPPGAAADIAPLLSAPSDALTGALGRPRVRPRERDAAFFQDYIQRDGGIGQLAALTPDALSESQRTVRENALYLVRRLEQLPEALRLRLARELADQCLLVVVSTPDLDSAYQIFSVLNTRGLDLSATDILKAELIGAIPRGEQEEYTRKWEDLEEALGREGFEALFSHTRMIQRKARARASVLKEFREAVLGPVPDARRLIDETIVPFGAALRTIRTTAYTGARGAAAVNAALGWLNLMSDSDWMPPALL